MTDKTPFLIRLENCSARLGRATILHGLDWTLRQGCHWLLLGANGAGKSTFLALVRGDIPPAPARPGEPAGRRIYGPGLSHDGEPTQSPIGLRQRLALVSAELQDRYVRRALGEEDRRAWNLTALDLAVAGLRDTPLVYSPPEPSEKMAALTALEALGATHLAGTGVQDMSRGQARLAFIARALAGRPDVLLCDEVLDGLDPTARDMISGALERLAASGSTTIVLSTHRTDEAPVWAERALLLAGGRITAHGPAAKVLKRSPAARGLDRPGENRTDALHEANGTDRAMPWLVRVDKATLLRGGRPALSDVDWTVLPGQRWGVFGHNGAGKSSLLALITGEQRPEPGGAVHWFGHEGRTDVRAMRRRLGLVSPELQAAYPPDATAMEAVLSGFHASLGLFDAPASDMDDALDMDKAVAMVDMEQRARRALAAAGQDLASDPERPVERLSYGQTRRLLIARALVHGPDLLLMDEAEAGLDGPSRAALQAVVEELARAGEATGTALVWVSHRPHELPSGLTHGLLMEHGRVTASGELDRVLPLVLQHLG